MSSPSPLQHTSERVLEFDQFRQLLSAYAASPLGRLRAQALAPSQDRSWIDREHQLTEEIRGFLRAGGSFDFYGLADPGSLIDKSRIKGSVLELLIAVPTHIVARHRDYCCAGLLTFIGLAMGVSVMLFAFGPVVLLLFAQRWQRLHPHEKFP